jgi:hypothetical protein
MYSLCCLKEKRINIISEGTTTNQWDDGTIMRDVEIKLKQDNY